MAAGDGLIVMTPTSIAVAGAGSSASINADGGVDFDIATSLSLNGVFASGFDNYLIVMRLVSAANPAVRIRMRAAGTDATGSNYASQYLAADNTGVTGARETAQTSMRFGESASAQRDGIVGHLYGPYLAQPTALRTVTAIGYLGGYIFDCAATHSLSTSYDGFTIFTSSSTITGNVAVFGYEE